MMFSQSIISLGLLLAVSSCSLLPEPEDTPDRFLLDAVNVVAFQKHARAQKKPALIVDQPVVYAPLDNTRVAIQPTAHTIDYLAAIEWGDRLSTLIHESTLQSLQNAGVFQSVGRLNSGQQAQYLMLLDVRHFNKDVSCNGAVAEYFVQVFDMEHRQARTSKLFHHCHELPKNADARDVALALNEAHKTLMQEIVSWLSGVL